MNFPEPFYKVVAGGSGLPTRQRRGTSGKHHYAQLFAGGDIVVRPNQPANVPGTVLEKFYEQFKSAWDRGLITIYRSHTEVLDLEEKVSISVETVEAPAPNFLPDSAARDLTFPEGIGTNIPQFAGNTPELGDPDLPAVIEKAKDESPVEPVDTTGDPVAARKQAKTKKEK